MLDDLLDPFAKSDPASQRVADHLRLQLLHGSIAPGQRIRQGEVAASFGVSRLPVREALRILAAEGLVELHANKGARVPHLSMRQVDIVYRMRESLEPLALAESLPSLTFSDVARLRCIQHEIESNADIERFLDLDREFHLYSYHGCTVEPLSSTVVRLWNTTQHHRRSFVTLTGSDRAWVVNAEHNLLLDAIEHGDTEAGQTILAGHIRRTRTELALHPELFH
ncbi:GntR family transcriptional regulator [Mycolicibacterium chlorophenolicum]|uniref:HTH-type transcriptional regulator McbR n=1 Tax=Mycolicibacterium chlorophenolicum TaxID=37916 RepID=A0A0J6WPK8_9MYCO|nr:GntR family transcriptional regulator [Mycolicibacterium chlorophenolicum]KMO83632.1 HTH-type transcriptional regulator McbR [Mycolicibacterium chlorophenolicum]